MPRRDGVGFEWAYRDLLIALLVVFMAMAILAVIARQRQTKAGVRPGALVFDLRWDMARNADVDLWVRAPGDHAVGFSHKSDAHCDLLRDDLGRRLDPSSRNEEMVVCRVAPPGEYVTDVMLYRSYDHVVPINATVVVKRIGANGIATLLERHVSLAHEGEQRTIWRFSLGAHGSLVPGSVNNVPVALYRGVAAVGATK